MHLVTTLRSEHRCGGVKQQMCRLCVAADCNREKRRWHEWMGGVDHGRDSGGIVAGGIFCCVSGGWSNCRVRAFESTSTCMDRLLRRSGDVLSCWKRVLDSRSRGMSSWCEGNAVMWGKEGRKRAAVKGLSLSVGGGFVKAGYCVRAMT